MEIRLRIARYYWQDFATRPEYKRLYKKHRTPVDIISGNTPMRGQGRRQDLNQNKGKC